MYITLSLITGRIFPLKLIKLLEYPYYLWTYKHNYILKKIPDFFRNVVVNLPQVAISMYSDTCLN